MEERPKGGGSVTLVIWLLIAISASGALYYAASTGLLSWSTLVEARTALNDLVAQSPILAVALYVGVFVTLSLVLFPAQLWIILVGGILFGFAGGFAITWFAAVFSSMIVYFVSKGTLGALYRRRAGKYLERVAEIFRLDQFWYMLTLRFVPICPYCIANIIPAMLGARPTPYLISTMIGVTPYIAVYSFAGAQAGSMLAIGEPPNLAETARLIIPVLAAFAALPILAIVARSASRRRAPQ